jgi:hypothetical protein
MERNMDESRKQFYEAFEVLTGWEVNDYPNRDVVRLCHQMWDMSRATIEIELPKNKWHPCDCIDVVIAFDRDDVIESICAAGIKVKE